MQSTQKNRIQKEIHDFVEKEKKGEDQSIKIIVTENDITHWKGYITGPADSVYQGGFYQIDIKIPNEYPYKPPKMQFDTRIWHPNISSQTGAICLDILKDEWSPALSIRTALLSLCILLQDPQADSPQDAVVANQFKSQRELFNKTAREWTLNYACKAKQEEKIANLINMGFTEKQSRESLIKFNWDEEQAIDYLLNQ